MKTTKSLDERFWEKVDILGEGGCWNWTAFKDKDGYGRIYLLDSDVRPGPYIRAHRLSWKIHFGEIPEGMWVLHSCDNPGCVCPYHLFLGTSVENTKDRDAKGRASRGEKHYASKFCNQDVEKIRLRQKSGETMTSIASSFGVTKQCIYRIVKRITWKHL